MTMSASEFAKYAILILQVLTGRCRPLVTAGKASGPHGAEVSNMADRFPKVTRGFSDASAEDLIRLARKAGKIKKKLDKKADAYLAGKYDPGKKLKKTAVRGAAAVVVAASLLAGSAFSDPAEIMEDQTAASYRQPPIVLDTSDFVNTPVEDDEDGNADEEKGAKSSIVSRFRQAVLSMPQSVRILIVSPLWLIGTALMTVVSFLWSTLFASPLGAFIASFALGFAMLTGLFAVTAKTLFPDLPLSRILSRKNVLILGCLAVLLSVFDAVAPMYWNKYPLAAALIKLALGGSVIGILTVRTRNLFCRLKLN